MPNASSTAQPNANLFSHRGFSLRQALIDQGVTEEVILRRHVAFIGETLAINPLLDITRYRVNPDDPNSPVGMMG